ncbi:unnamed protein product [Heterobilharzia americana]|nr:unnamed protein product [Heterobilharzia americana]CAH8520723.1 unnamed protein product [Heterobilharzia americana]
MMASSLCITASAISPDIGDSIEVPFICLYITPLNWKYVVRQRSVSSIRLENISSMRSEKLVSSLSSRDIVPLASWSSMEVYSAVTSKDIISSPFSILMLLIFSKNPVSDLVECPHD